MTPRVNSSLPWGSSREVAEANVVTEAQAVSNCWTLLKLKWPPYIVLQVAGWGWRELGRRIWSWGMPTADAARDCGG